MPISIAYLSMINEDRLLIFSRPLSTPLSLGVEVLPMKKHFLLSAGNTMPMPTLPKIKPFNLFIYDLFVCLFMQNTGIINLAIVFSGVGM